ncbi:hypothetical protein [Clostridium estertheticum]|nr:hypothetical protein [Clostridium estertheticum]
MSITTSSATIAGNTVVLSSANAVRNIMITTYNRLMNYFRGGNY